jgi:hypothetical protein
MVRHLIAAATFFLLLTPVRAQQDPPQQSKNGVYAEFYLLRHDFSDGFVSLNYERLMGTKERTHLRLGVYPDFQSTISFPLTITRMTGPTLLHHFEYGAGLVFRMEHYVDPYDPAPMKTWFFDMPALMVPLMYRFQKNDGLYFRAGFNVFLSWPVLPSPSFSLGYRF